MKVKEKSKTNSNLEQEMMGRMYNRLVKALGNRLDSSEQVKCSTNSLPVSLSCVYVCICVSMGDLKWENYLQGCWKKNTWKPIL